MEDFMVAHISTQLEEKGKGVEFNFKHFLFSMLRVETCASACFGHFQLKFYSFLFLLCLSSPLLEVHSPQITD